MIRKGLLAIVLFILLAGCTNQVGGNYFFDKLSTIEKNLSEHEPDWNSVHEKSMELKNLYKENKWKIQLLGDEGEYEGLSNSIEILITAIDEKDKTNARIELVTIKSFLEDIYSL